MAQERPAVRRLCTPPVPGNHTPILQKKPTSEKGLGVPFITGQRSRAGTECKEDLPPEADSVLFATIPAHPLLKPDLLKS